MSGRIKSYGWALVIIALVVFLALLLIPQLPSFPIKAQKNSIINNLRQLDGAMQQWALENHHAGAVQVTEQDLAPYLKNGWVNSVDGERYILRTIEDQPVALLTRDLGKGKKFLKGTYIRLPPLGNLADFQD